MLVHLPLAPAPELRPPVELMTVSMNETSGGRIHYATSQKFFEYLLTTDLSKR